MSRYQNINSSSSVIEQFPENDAWKIDSNTKFANIVTQLYKMCVLLQSHVRINFLDNNQDLSSLGIPNIQKTIIWLFKIIQGIVSYHDRNHIGLQKTIAQNFTNKEVNTYLIQQFRTDDAEEETKYYTVFISKYISFS